MMAVRARRHIQDLGPPLQAVTREPFLIQTVTGPSRYGDVAACRAGMSGSFCRFSSFPRA